MKKLILICLLTFFMLITCQKEEQSIEKTGDGKRKIASVNYPLHYFTQRIGGNQIVAELPVPTDVDPAYWQPDAKAKSIFQQVDVIFLNGAGYAKWIDKVSLPTSRMINTSDGFKKKYIELVEGMTHSHCPEGDHVHKGYAFTTWLNIKLAIEQATKIKEHLVRIIPRQNEYLD